MMRFFLKSRAMIFLGLYCILLLLSACATTAQTGDTIEKRATARWDVLLSGDLAGAYEFRNPSKGRW